MHLALFLLSIQNISLIYCALLGQLFPWLMQSCTCENGYIGNVEGCSSQHIFYLAKMVYKLQFPPPKSCLFLCYATVLRALGNALHSCLQPVLQHVPRARLSPPLEEWWLRRRVGKNDWMKSWGGREISQADFVVEENVEWHPQTEKIFLICPLANYHPSHIHNMSQHSYTNM